MDIARDRQAGFDWVERTLGGKIIGEETHNRWRPQYFLDVRRADGTIQPVVLRGFRNPGYTAPDEAGARQWLHVESEILKALQNLPVSTPGYLGHDPQGGWMLMERLAGEGEITALPDSPHRTSIYRDYMLELAKLHAVPIETIALSDLIPQPASVAEHFDRLYREHIAYYRSLTLTRPEPVFELGIQWLADHRPPPGRHLSLGLGDVGPNQFLFTEQGFNALIDFEYGMVADPLMEMGMMRAREFQYPIGDLAAHLLAYGEKYQQLSGKPFDLDALRYWTVAGPILWNLMISPGIHQPDPKMVDIPFVFAWAIQQQRAITEALAEYHGLRLEAPEIGNPDRTIASEIHDLIIGQFRQYYEVRASDIQAETFARYSTALAEVARRGDAYGRQIHTENFEELSDLLCARPRDWNSGLYALQEAIAQDYGKDFERRLTFLYRMEYRREFLYAPIQHATGVASGWALGRFDDLPGIAPSLQPVPRSKAEMDSR